MAERSVLITGGTGGLGGAVTDTFLEAGWRVVSSHLTVRGVVPGISATDFATAADKAKDGCPISQALKGNVALSVDATLVA